MITGASRGLGDTLVKRFLASGYRVFATARTLPLNAQPGVTWKALDVLSYEQCCEAISFGFERFGRIDVLINNASGYTGGTTIAEVAKEDIDLEINVTFKAAVYLSQIFVKQARFQKHGKIIFISSVAGLLREPDCDFYSVYSASKAGLIRFSECLNSDIMSYGMQSHVVIPCNMREVDDQTELERQKAVSYTSVADSIVQLIQQKGNLSLGHVILQPAH
jgi:3-oxoacyl-[acyl-carrier protein] reductase